MANDIRNHLIPGKLYNVGNVFGSYKSPLMFIKFKPGYRPGYVEAVFLCENDFANPSFHIESIMAFELLKLKHL